MPPLSRPTQNYFKVPNDFWNFEELTVHEKIVLLYLIRHTWGFSEFGKPKRITIDEFQNGRKYKDGSRIDSGCQIGRATIHRSLNRLDELGYILVETDDSDLARVKKAYSLIITSDENSVPERNAEFQSGTLESHSGTRSEKDTIERHPKKERKESSPATPADETAPVNVPIEDQKDKKPTREKTEYNLLYESVASSIFGITGTDQLKAMVKSDATRIGMITAWLAGKQDGVAPRGKKKVLGFISAPAEPRHVLAFAAWWKREYRDATLPTDGEKFVLAWRKFASSASKANGYVPARERLATNGATVPDRKQELDTEPKF